MRKTMSTLREELTELVVSRIEPHRAGQRWYQSLWYITSLGSALASLSVGVMLQLPWPSESYKNAASRAAGDGGEAASQGARVLAGRKPTKLPRYVGTSLLR